MRQIVRNQPLRADDISVCLDSARPGEIYILNRTTSGTMSYSFKPTIENIESVMKQCFDFGKQARSAEMRRVLEI